jgi:hypothetical protein
VLDEEELRAVRLCYDMWDISASCEVTEDDLTTFYDDLPAVEKRDDESKTVANSSCGYNNMVDVVRVIAADSFHITASDFLEFAVTMKKIVAETNISIDLEEESEEREKCKVNKLRTTPVYDGWEVGWSDDQFYYAKDGESHWSEPEGAVRL